MDRTDVMQCRNFRMGTCERSDPIVLEEDRYYVQLGCRTCRGGWVVTMPDGKARARYENRLKEIKLAEERRRARESKPTIFA